MDGAASFSWRATSRISDFDGIMRCVLSWPQCNLQGLPPLPTTSTALLRSRGCHQTPPRPTGALRPSELAPPARRRHRPHEPPAPGSLGAPRLPGAALDSPAMAGAFGGFAAVSPQAPPRPASAPWPGSSRPDHCHPPRAHLAAS
jgi:hypothetical protein